MPESADTIVVGAGFAGLVAARELSAAGQKVIVIEGRDRIGGRTWTSEFAGTSLEFGGAYVHWFQPHVWTEVTRYGLALKEIPNVASAFWIEQGALHQGPADELSQRSDDLFVRFNREAAQVLERPYDPAFAPGLDAVDALTVQDRIDELQLAPGDADILNGIHCSMSSGFCAESGLVSMMRWYALAGWDRNRMFDAVGRYKLARGTSALASAIADSSTAELWLGERVTSVTQDDGVTVSAESGRQATASRAIVTAPLNVLDQISFDPGLDPRVDKLIAQKHAGQGFKAWVHVANELDDFFALAPDSYPINWIQSETRPDGGGMILLAFGPDGTALDVTDRAQVGAALKRIMPDLELIATSGHNWRTDPFSGGTWAVLRPNQLTQLLPALQEPHQRIVFAGAETSRGWNGFIDGAIESGLRAARWVQSEAS